MLRAPSHLCMGEPSNAAGWALLAFRLPPVKRASSPTISACKLLISQKPREEAERLTAKWNQEVGRAGEMFQWPHL